MLSRKHHCLGSLRFSRCKILKGLIWKEEFPNVTLVLILVFIFRVLFLLLRRVLHTESCYEWIQVTEGGQATRRQQNNFWLFSIPTPKWIIWLTITIVLGEFLQLWSYHICKAGGVGTVLKEEEKKKRLAQVVCLIRRKCVVMKEIHSSKIKHRLSVLHVLFFVLN